MVGTRSGIETNPAPATQEEDVPRQIEVTSMEQEEEIPSTNPVSGLQLPISNLQTPVGRTDIYIAGTDNRTPRTLPEQRVVALGQSPIYLGGTSGVSPIHKKTPSVPTDFRPSQFAFMPQPDFQSARETMEKEDEDMVTPDKGVQGYYSSRVPNFQAPMTPLDVASTSYLDYTKVQSIKFYNKGCEKLPGEQFNGKLLITWLVQIQDKASMFTWLPILTIKGKLLTQQFAELTMEEVVAHAQTYQDKASREAQNAQMLITCLKASITRSVYNKVYLQMDKYIIYRKNTLEPVEDGVCFLKTIIDNYHSNTRSSTKQIRKQLAQLNYYMRNVAKGDVSKLCEHTRQLMYELNATGETTNDLLANLLEALKEAPDSNFQRWLSNQVDLWSMRKLDWKADGSDIMEEAENYYREALSTHKWGKKAQRRDTVYAFKAEGSETEDEEPDGTNQGETIKALTAKLKTLEAKSANWSDSKSDSNKDDKWAWKLTPPKDGEATTKKVTVDGRTKTYYWCTYYHQWTIHKPSECKKKSSRLQKKQVFKKNNKSKSTNYKAKKAAYIHAKAAYDACVAGTSDSDGSVSEGSNKSESEYSSEGSNAS